MNEEKEKSLRERDAAETRKLTELKISKKEAIGRVNRISEEIG